MGSRFVGKIYQYIPGGHMIETLVVYGFFRDFHVVVRQPTASFVNIILEGVQADDILEHPDVRPMLDYLTMDRSDTVMDRSDRVLGGRYRIKLSGE